MDVNDSLELPQTLEFATPEPAKAQQPAALEILYELGLLYQQTGMKEEATSAIQKSLAHSQSKGFSAKFAQSLARIKRCVIACEYDKGRRG